ncbi:MAG: hypothetical protein IKW54_04600 [Bacteroidales bacterium]|nr:hypothetical protein [Bacteroidales bacterium]
MLNFFKHSYLYQQIVIVLMALVLWMPAFITKSAFIPGEHNTPLYNVIISVFNFSPFLLNTVAFAVYLFSVFLFNSVLSANRLVSKYSTVGAFSFVLMMCCSPELHSCYPFLFACPFILMAMHTLFLIYQTDTPENYMMNIGYFIAFASLFYYQSVFLVIWVILSFIILGFKEIRYMCLPLVGYLIIYGIVLGIVFLFGDVNVLIDSYSHFFRNISFSLELTSFNKIILIVTAVLFLISLLRSVGNRNSDKGSNIRKRVGVAFLLTLFAGLIFFIHEPSMNNSLVFMMFAFFYAIALSDIKKTKIANIVTIIVTLIIIANQYLPLFGITI